MIDRIQSIIYRIAVDTKGLAEEIAKAKAAIASLQEHNNRLAAAQKDNAEGTKKLAEAQKGLAGDIDNTGKAVDRVNRKTKAATSGTTSQTPVGRAPAQPLAGHDYRPYFERLTNQMRECCDAMKAGGGDRDRGSGGGRDSSQGNAYGG